ncbi:hypothetical protein F0562_022561 [Nyssa sinensis]|uniref:Retroviral polymerase SH3-like domain-containing protein n=1 Tax=Nyssa sinensis TaxID=561372 RepID=A0A5J5BR53_9ASTE|nr:hypothetical protein F0562_022561 [Nyssa sinensis]
MSPHKHKFSPRAIKGIFVGYPFGQRGYRHPSPTNSSSIVLPFPMTDYAPVDPRPLGVEPSAIPSSSLQPLLRRSSRTHHLPNHLQDYYCSLVTQYPLMPCQSQSPSPSNGVTYPL